MKKLILILFFTLLTATSFAQASAASARMFKNRKAWAEREKYRSNGYTLDTAELYAIIRLSKDFEGHVNWQYATSNIANTFSSLFPILGRTNGNAMATSYYNFQTGVRYLEHRIGLTGSPTLSNNSIVFNGTTQYGTLWYFRDWAGTFAYMTPRLLMDTLLNVSATDTAAQTNMNMSMYVKDSLDRFVMGSFQSATPNRDWRLFKVSNTYFSYRSFIETNSSNQTITASSAGNYYASNRSNLSRGVAHNGTLYSLTADGSYNFGLPRNITTNIELMGGTSLFQAGTIYYFDITNRALTADEHLNKYNAIKEFVRRKTQ